MVRASSGYIRGAALPRLAPGVVPRNRRSHLQRRGCSFRTDGLLMLAYRPRQSRSGSSRRHCHGHIGWHSAVVDPFLGPLFLYSLRRVSWKSRLAGIAALGITVTGWFLAHDLGQRWFPYLLRRLAVALAHGSFQRHHLNSSPVNSVARAFTIVFIYFLCFGAAPLHPSAHRSVPRRQRRARSFSPRFGWFPRYASLPSSPETRQ